MKCFLAQFIFIAEMQLPSDVRISKHKPQIAKYKKEWQWIPQWR